MNPTMINLDNADADGSDYLPQTKIVVSLLKIVGSWLVLLLLLGGIFV